MSDQYPQQEKAKICAFSLYGEEMDIISRADAIRGNRNESATIRQIIREWNEHFGKPREKYVVNSIP